jgi:hypothetical protein
MPYLILAFGRFTQIVRTAWAERVRTGRTAVGLTHRRFSNPRRRRSGSVASAKLAAAVALSLLNEGGDLVVVPVLGLPRGVRGFGRSRASTEWAPP